MLTIHYGLAMFLTKVETTFIIKHVEQHGRREANDPWSIRRMGIYHKHSRDLGDLFIVINPSLALRQRLKMIRTSPHAPSPGDIQIAILSCAMDNWRWYISHTEKRYLDMVSIAFFVRER